MNNSFSIALTIFLTLSTLNFKHDNSLSKKVTKFNMETVTPQRAIQISGVGFYAESGECEDVEGFSYAVRMTGDLEGCLYAFIDNFECSPSGTYREEGREYFVGTYKGEFGTFWTNYKFEAKYEECVAGSGPLGAEIFGRCQHPIENGSGTGVFEGVKGRIDMKDNVELANFPYRGHLKF